MKVLSASLLSTVWLQLLIPIFDFLAIPGLLSPRMVSIDAGDIKLQDAINATSAMSLRDLADHVWVGLMPPGAITILELPLRELDSKSIGLRHFVGH